MLLLIAAVPAARAREPSGFLVQDLAPKGYFVAQESKEMTQRLRAAIGEISGLPVVSRELTDGAWGPGEVDMRGCVEFGKCLDALADFAGAAYVVRGSVGKMGSRGYLILELRDCARSADLALATRSWQSREEEEIALESAAYEVTTRSGGRAGGIAGRLDPNSYQAAGGKPMEKKSVPLAMTLALLPGAGFMYLDRYGMATAYFISEIAMGLAGTSFLARKDYWPVMGLGSAVGALKYAEVIHTGVEARRQNRNLGFVRLRLAPDEAGPAPSSPPGRLQLEYAYKF